MSDRPIRVQPPVEKVAPGLWCIPTVVPDNPIGWTQTYLIESSDGPYLVDTGWNHDLGLGGPRRRADGVRHLGRGRPAGSSSRTTTRITSGSWAGSVRPAAAGWACHDADTALARRHREILLDDPGLMLAETLQLLQEADAGPCEIDEMKTAMEAFTMEVPELPDRHLSTQTLVLGDRQVDLLHTPGHTPGHLCLRIEPAAHR